MANRDRDKIEPLPMVGAPRLRDDGALLPRPPEGSFSKPVTVGCVFVQSNPRIGELSPAAYAELLEEL